MLSYFCLFPSVSWCGWSLSSSHLVWLLLLALELFCLVFPPSIFHYCCCCFCCSNASNFPLFSLLAIFCCWFCRWFCSLLDADANGNNCDSIRRNSIGRLGVSFSQSCSQMRDYLSFYEPSRALKIRIAEADIIKCLLGALTLWSIFQSHFYYY